MVAGEDKSTSGAWILNYFAPQFRLIDFSGSQDDSHPHLDTPGVLRVCEAFIASGNRRGVGRKWIRMWS